MNPRAGGRLNSQCIGKVIRSSKANTAKSAAPPRNPADNVRKTSVGDVKPNSARELFSRRSSQWVANSSKAAEIGDGNGPAMFASAPRPDGSPWYATRTKGNERRRKRTVRVQRVDLDIVIFPGAEPFFHLAHRVADVFK